MGTNPLVVALDVPDLVAATRLADQLAGEVGWFKVGLELFGAVGPQAVREVGRHAPVFLDLKLHDIPNTVERAARVVGELGISLLTVHASGGPAVIAAAARGLSAAAPDARLLAVTVLTSFDDATLAAVNQPRAAEQVPALARVAVDAGARGLVCAPGDVATVRVTVGPEVLLVVPGIRPTGAPSDDQARTGTPAAAIRDGADLLVVGRPITRADDPVGAARAVVAEVEQARP